MPISLHVLSLVIVFVYFVTIFWLLRRKKFALRYCLIWLFSGVILLVIVIWPNLFTEITASWGIEVASNGFFAICVVLITSITVSLTVAISDFSVRIKSLIQNVALLEKRVRELEKEHNEE